MTESRPAMDEDVDLFSREACRDPQAHDSRVRERAPVVYLPRYDVWATGRHDVIQQMMHDWRTFSSTRPAFQKGRSAVLLSQDPPDHDRLRRVVERALSPATLRRLQAAFRDAAERLVDKILGETSLVDGHGDLAKAYVLEVFPDALGLGVDGRENLIRFGHARFNAFGPDNEIFEESDAGAAEVFTWVDAHARRDAVAPDGIAASLFACADDGEVTAEEATLLLRSLYAAGADTTVFAIGKILKAVADFPEQWQLLREDPDKLRSAFEEGLRYDNPARFTRRRTTTDVELDGVRLPADAKILLLHMPGGRDPRRWEAPDTYDIRRDVIGQHLGLGFGVHACVGALLARMEVMALLGTLARRVRAVAPAGDPRPTENMAVHGYEHLPLRLEAA